MDSLDSGFWRRICALVLTQALWAALYILSWGAPVACGQLSQDASTVAIGEVRSLVKRNEDLTNLIKMRYVADLDISAEMVEVRKRNEQGNRRRGAAIESMKGIWAQDDVKQYVDVDIHYVGKESAGGLIEIVDGEVCMSAKKPDLMRGHICSAQGFDWLSVGPLLLGMGPYQEGGQRLSQLLDNRAQIQGTETIDGRQAWVVDISVPDRNVVRRYWIDRERGAQVRMASYDKSPRLADATLYADITGIRLHQVANGGWVPVEGKRSSYFGQKSSGEVISTHVTVDVNSITIRREDIPDSLFSIKFPDDAEVYNAITETWNKGGKPFFPTLVNEVDKFIDQTIQEMPLAAINTSAQTDSNTSEPPRLGKIPEAQSVPPSMANSQDVEPTRGDGTVIVWILVAGFVAAFGLTSAVMLARRSSKSMVRGKAK